MIYGKLGRDFWLYRIGQAISVTGSGSSRIAFAWWVLEKTGSAVSLAEIASCALFVQNLSLLIFSPLGDRFERRKLIILSDFIRGISAIILCLMAFFDHYIVWLVWSTSLSFAFGNGIFGISAKAILPQLVSKEDLREAVRQGQMVMSLGNVLGTLLGGVIVSSMGVGAAFAFDAVSYCLALMATSAIATSFQTPKCGVRFSDFLSKWHKDLLAGFRVLSHLPTIYGLVSILIFVDLALAPFLMEIAVLVKLTKNLPPWFLGSLNSCLSLGAICGAVSIKFVCSNNRLDRTIFHGILIMGICIFILPIIPNFLWSFFVIFLIGIGSFSTEIPINTQITLAMPDSLRSRIDAIVGTCCGLMAPLGMLGAGYLMKAFGPQFSVSLSGLLLLLLAPSISPSFWSSL